MEHRALRERAGDLVGAGQHRVGALRQRRRRQRLVEAEVRSPRLVDDQRLARRVGDLREPRDIGGHPVVGRRYDERGACVGRSAERRRERVGRDAVGDPELLVVLGHDEARQAAAQHEPVDHRRVRVALDHDPRPERGERQAQRVVALRRPVRQEPAAGGAERLGGHRLGPLVRGRRRADVDSVDQLRHVGGQRVEPDRLDHAGIGSGATLVARNVVARRAPERVLDDRVEVRRDRLLGNVRGGRDPRRRHRRFARAAHRRHASM